MKIAGRCGRKTRDRRQLLNFDIIFKQKIIDYEFGINQVEKI